MTTYTEKADGPTLDRTLAIFETLEDRTPPSWNQPGWATNGFEALIRIRELVQHGRGGPAMLAVVAKLGMENESLTHPVQDSQAFLEFLLRLNSAYLIDALLHSAGIDPTTI